VLPLCLPGDAEWICWRQEDSQSITVYEPVVVMLCRKDSSNITRNKCKAHTHQKSSFWQIKDFQFGKIYYFLQLSFVCMPLILKNNVPNKELDILNIF
jgi:hypothetical protein